MSLDLYLDDSHVGNFTHNVTPMWRKAGCYEALYKSDGKKAGEVSKQIDSALIAMAMNPDTFKRLDAPNGWGTYPQALGFLAEVAQAFRESPEAVIRVSA